MLAHLVELSTSGGNPIVGASAVGPLVRVLTAAEVADTAAKPDGNMLRVASDVPVETLLPQLASHTEGVAVENGSGEIVGVATAHGVVAALARESAKRANGEEAEA